MKSPETMCHKKKQRVVRLRHPCHDARQWPRNPDSGLGRERPLPSSTQMTSSSSFQKCVSRAICAAEPATSSAMRAETRPSEFESVVVPPLPSRLHHRGQEHRRPLPPDRGHLKSYRKKETVSSRRATTKPLQPGMTCQRQGPVRNRRGGVISLRGPALLALLLVTLLSTGQGSEAARASKKGKVSKAVASTTTNNNNNNKKRTAYGLRCPPCRKIHCAISDPKQLDCQGGVSTGVCGCCPVCARLSGQTCGGDLSYLGRCDRGLTCRTDPRAHSLPAYRKQRQPPGVCAKVGSSEQADEAVPKKCKPRCTQHFCSRRPRAICSASKGTAETERPCQGSCQHTSCRACAVVDDIECVRCAGHDFRCLKQFGRCVARQRCRGKAGRRLCRRLRIKGNIGRRFVCKVPDCPS